MASNEGHIHWTGAPVEEQAYLGQSLTVSAIPETGDPIGAIRIKATGYVGSGVFLPNSSHDAPVWSVVPGTAPVLEVRQDGHYRGNFIRIRQQ